MNSLNLWLVGNAAWALLTAPLWGTLGFIANHVQERNRT